MSKNTIEYFDKKLLIKELIDFEQTAVSTGVSEEYSNGVRAIINRLQMKKADLIERTKFQKVRKEKNNV